MKTVKEEAAGATDKPYDSNTGAGGKSGTKAADAGSESGGDGKYFRMT